MKQILLIILTITVIKLDLISQINYCEAYYPFVNKAEINIVHGKYSEALLNYESAFKSVEHKFSVDLYNAMICAGKTKNSELIKSYAFELQKLGIEKSSLIKKVNTLPNCAKIIEDLPEQHSKYLEKLSMRKSFEKLSFKDQEYRIKEGSYSIYGEKIDSIDKVNISEFFNLVKKHGFPSEKQLGTNKIHNGFESSIVLHHHCQQRSLDTTNNYPFTQLFKESIQNGELEPNKAAFLLDLQSKNTEIELAGFGSIIFQKDTIESELLRQSVSPEKVDQINEDRKRFGMDNIDDYYKKVEFAFFSKESTYFNFTKYKRKNIMPLPSELYDKIIESYIPVNQNYR